MNVYYILNSGFSIENDGDLIIIDYYSGKLSDKWNIPSAESPDSYKSISVLASHIHGDHFIPEIFSWTAERPDIKYLLSSDIIAARSFIPKECMSSIAFISDGEVREINGYTVTAYGSTDAGVSFHIEKDGLSIFHAGDLNYWHWADESTEDEIREAREMFEYELSKIKKGVDRIDVAFFPVDPRLKTDYYRGAIMFCEAMSPKILIPMHFGLHFDPPQEFFDEVSKLTEVKMADRGKKETKIEIGRI